MYALDFEYAGEKLSDYGMMLCTFNAFGTQTVSSGSDLTFQQIRPGGSNRFRLYGSTYENAYSTTFQICKSSYHIATSSGQALTVAELSALQRWLCRKSYHRFKIHQPDYESIYWNAVFTSKQILLGGQAIGLELTMYTDAPFAYMDEITIEQECSKDSTFDIYDSSDEEGFLYPDCVITLLEDGKDMYVDGNLKYHQAFSISNSMDNRMTVIENCLAGETITLKGKNQMIQTESSAHVPTLAKDFNYHFPKIINTYHQNQNTFSCNCNCKLTLSYSPIRKVGL